MKTYKITVEYESQMPDAFKRQQVWQVNQQALDKELAFLKANVVKVTEIKEAANENDQAKAH